MEARLASGELFVVVAALEATATAVGNGWLGRVEVMDVVIAYLQKVS
jgi:hypothetical protein